MTSELGLGVSHALLPKPDYPLIDIDTLAAVTQASRWL